ncbi:MAG: hypothetical protein P8N43_11140 [Alphaproteobacteria bacterium]|jgi:hypothetical protein|nr:hypothetical protein [Alphaproteobacteria bacterium]
MPGNSDNALEMGEKVAWILDFWKARRQGNRPPNKQIIDAVNIGRANPKILRHLCLYDVEREPYRFRYRLVGGAIPDAGGLAKPGSYIDEVDTTGRLDAHLIKVCETGEPWYKIGPPMIAHLTKIVAVEAITLPLDGTGDRIDFLLSCSVYHWEAG